MLRRCMLARIRDVLYRGEQTTEEIFFRTLLFKLFNRIEAWKHLETICGPMTLKAFDFDRHATALDTISQLGNQAEGF